MHAAALNSAWPDEGRRERHRDREHEARITNCETRDVLLPILERAADIEIVIEKLVSR